MKRLALSAVLLVLAGCSSGSVDFDIDNPTDAALSLQIDDKAYQVPAHGSIPVTLAAGEHKLDSAKTGALRFIVYTGRKGGLINPALADYVIVQQVYVTDASKLQNFGRIERTITLNGQSYKGPFTQVHDLFIDRDWKFGVHEALPHEITGHDPGNGGNFFNKIFSAADFVDFYHQEYNQPELYKGQTAIADNRPNPPSTVPRSLPDFDDPEMQQAAAPLRAHYLAYLQAKDPAEQERLQKQDFDLEIAFTNASAQRLGKLSVEENKKHNAFVEQHGRLMGMSAVVEP